MSGNSISEKIKLVLMLAFVVVLAYTATAWAFNRISGNNFEPGDGLIFRNDGGGGAKDSLHLAIGWGQYLDGDSIKWKIADWDDSVATIHSAQTISGAKTFSALITGTNGLTINSATVDFTGATVTLGNNAVQTGEIEDGTILFGDFNSATMDTIHASHFAWKKSTEAAGAYRDGIPVNFKDGSNVTITITDHGTDSATVEIASTGGATWPGWHESGQANTTDTLAFKEMFGIDITQIDGSGDADTLTIEVDSAVIKTLMTRHDFFQLHFKSVSGGSDDSVEVIVPTSGVYSNVTHGDLVRVINTSTVDGQLCTLEYIGYNPMGYVNDSDSLSWDMRTSTDQTTDAYAKLIFYAMTTAGGYPVEDTVKYTGSATASSSGGAPRHVAVAGGSIGAIGPGAYLTVKVEVMVDVGDTTDVKGVMRLWGDKLF